MDAGTLVGFWLVCGIVGGIIANSKGAGVTGFFLGILLGPLGVLAAFAVDGRETCTRCGTKLNGTPEICPMCHEPTGHRSDLERPDNLSEAAEQEYVRRVRAQRSDPGRGGLR